ncbi:excisionase [Buttiauxella ferragutiae]|uniref:excisionase n=1 Tax=Buttiauxella ferragutiae TaxID=82989 RepID=UPI0009451BAF|nr:excisionase [Buttiauxella ferragutiae]
MKLLTLERWAEERYEEPPSIGTLRRWARNGNIYPAPELSGTSYKVRPDAVYIKPNKYSKTMSVHHAANRPLKNSILERIDEEARKA